jgi:hypothetical protein
VLSSVGQNVTIRIEVMNSKSMDRTRGCFDQICDHFGLGRGIKYRSSTGHDPLKNLDRALEIMDV